MSARVTERSYYATLLNVISAFGGSGAQEVSYNGEPDIQFELLGETWLLGVKIGSTSSILRDAFVQFARHKRESGLAWGILLFLPEAARRVQPSTEALQQAIESIDVIALIDAGRYQQQYADRPFPEILTTLRSELAAPLSRGETAPYPLSTVLDLLRVQVRDLMDQLSIGETDVLRVITDRRLLSDLGSLNRGEAGDVTRFLAAYIILSQILFLRLLAYARPSMAPSRLPVTRGVLREAFAQVLNINYEDIFTIDVLDALPEAYLQTTFDLIWALQVEKSRYELPGRIFHDLMPRDIRKLLAAFYTRPQAADLLARIAIRAWDDRVLDPACGSGTILVSTYKEKLRRYERDRHIGNPHRAFCEEHLFGADIMPFAVHLTSANLAAMNVTEALHGVQVLHGDSLALAPGIRHRSGLQRSLYAAAAEARARYSGPSVALTPVDLIAMNPPFTKVERRIRDFVRMESFDDVAGGEVGLWGHFLFLAKEFLRSNGRIAAVIPINVLRGRESEHIRELLFGELTPRFVLKAVFNYGFSEWAEYRDIVIVAEAGRPPPHASVKFGLIKYPLTALEEGHIQAVVDTIKTREEVRSRTLDLDTHPLREVRSRFTNMMWFLSGSDFSGRDQLVRFLSSFSLSYPTAADFKEGYRPVPKGVSKFLFLTRDTNPARTQQAALTFRTASPQQVRARTRLGVEIPVETSVLARTLRTPVGLTSMDVGDSFDYLTIRAHRNLGKILRAVGFRSEGLRWERFWTGVSRVAGDIASRIVMSHRINPFSPNTHHVAFYSDRTLSVSNQFNVIIEPSAERAKALTVVLNSIIFWSQFFMLKEESTGRYINIRFYDTAAMKLRPSAAQVEPLVEVFETYRDVDFPALRFQLDEDFDDRYEEYRQKGANGDGPSSDHLFGTMSRQAKPSALRRDFDARVVEALGVNTSQRELLRVYDILVNDMFVTQALRKD